MQGKPSLAKLFNSFHTATTTSEAETDDSDSSSNSISAVMDMSSVGMDVSNHILDNFQTHLQQQMQMNQMLRYNMEQLEEENIREQKKKSKRRRPQDYAALVLTDVADSTRLWESNPMAMRKALLIHDKIVRKLTAMHEGFESDTEGDCFYLAFHEASHAVLFALALQEELHAAPWSDEILRLTETLGNERRGLRVRVAISMGNVESMPNPVTHRTQYFGPTFNATKKIEKMSKGGRILTTDVTWNAAVRQMDLLALALAITVPAVVMMQQRQQRGCQLQYVVKRVVVPGTRVDSQVGHLWKSKERIILLLLGMLFGSVGMLCRHMTHTLKSVKTYLAKQDGDSTQDCCA